MASNQYINKVIYGGQTLIDLTADDVAASDVLSGKKFHLPSGAPGTGTCPYDADTSDATAVAASGTISAKAEQYTVPQGYHDGSGKVSISATEQAKIIAGNIKSGIEILGVTGTYAGDTISAQAKTATPTTAQQTILPDTGYDYLSQVTVAAIPYTETDNTAGGKTVTIAA